MASSVLRQAPVPHAHASHRRRESSADTHPSAFNSSYPMSKSHSHNTWNSLPAPPPQSRAKGGLNLQTSYKQSRILPDIDDEDSMYPPHRGSQTHEMRRPPRLQPSRHGQRPAFGSPVTPTAAKKLNLRSPSSDLSSLPEGTEDHAALRRAEAEAVARYRMEREVEQARKEQSRSSGGDLQRSPVSARSDDAWGTSMYDVEVDGRR